MKLDRNTRAGAALTGGCAVVGMGLFGLSVDSDAVAPVGTAVLAPVTGLSQTLDQVTTTTMPTASFRPIVTATPPPPPTD